jgi:hypothetical protein
VYLDDGRGGEGEGVGDLVEEAELLRGRKGLEAVERRADAAEAEVQRTQVAAWWDTRESLG